MDFAQDGQSWEAGGMVGPDTRTALQIPIESCLRCCAVMGVSLDKMMREGERHRRIFSCYSRCSNTRWMTAASSGTTRGFIRNASIPKAWAFSASIM